MVRTKNPEKTRQKLLYAAYRVVHRKGFHAAGLDEILTEAKVTKGALYHHFGSKNDLVHAVINECVRTRIVDGWVTPLAGGDARDPITRLQQRLQHSADSVAEDELKMGCPLNNLTQELSAADESFRAQLNEVLQTWGEGIAQALRAGQDAGSVRTDVDAEAASTFVVAAAEGIIGLSKSYRCTKRYRMGIEELIRYTETLRPLPS